MRSLELGPEKLVARYVGPAEAMAFNESVLRESLVSLQGQRFTPGSIPAAEKVTWSAMTDAERPGVLPVPAGWVVEPGRPSPCRGLPAPHMVASAFPAARRQHRAPRAVWSAGVVPDAAALACSPRRGTLGRRVLLDLRGTWLGVSYMIEGTFTQAARGRSCSWKSWRPNRERVRAGHCWASGSRERASSALSACGSRVLSAADG